jgi:hypothetical protein
MLELVVIRELEIDRSIHVGAKRFHMVRLKLIRSLRGFQVIK